MPRRLPARIAATLLLVPFLLRAGDRGCRQHGEHLAKATTAAQVNAAQEHMHHHGGSEPSRAPADHHSSADCCPAMSSCGGAAVQASVHELAAVSTHDDGPVHVAALLQSRVESPDPPPPKA